MTHETAQQRDPRNDQERLRVLCIFQTSIVSVVYQLYQFYTLGCVPPGRRDPSIARLGCTGLSWAEPAGCKVGSLEDWRGLMVSSLPPKITQERGPAPFLDASLAAFLADMPAAPLLIITMVVSRKPLPAESRNLLADGSIS